MKRRSLFVGATAVCSLLVATPVAQAKGADAKRQLHSFDGTCEIEGTVHFSPAATYQQQILTVEYEATGTCSGTLDGQSVSDAPVAMHNQATSDGSCLYAQTLAPGPGSLGFENGATIYYGMEFTHVFSDGIATYTGQTSGSATGRETFLTPRTPPDISVHCYDGTGISDIPMDLTLATTSPLTSSSRWRG
jgi:hypothetical protein